MQIPNPGLPHQAQAAQSLQFAGVDSSTAQRVAQLGPNLGHPDLDPLFADPHAVAIHGSSGTSMQSLSAAAYSTDTNIAMSRAQSLDPQVVAHEAAHIMQQRGGAIQ